MLQEEFDNRFGATPVDLSIWTRRIKPSLNDAKKCNKKRIYSWIPILKWLPKYDLKNWIVPDLLCGITVGVFQVPQGMAYALVTGLDPVFGLYTSFFPPLIYTIFGTSKHTSVGTFAVLSLMIGAVLSKTAPPAAGIAPFGNDTLHAAVLGAHNLTETHSSFWCGAAAKSIARDQTAMVEIAMSLTVLIGILELLFGFLNMGCFAVYLSDQVVAALTTGAAFHIFLTQVTYATGIPNLPSTTEPLGILKFLVCFFTRITEIKMIPIVGCLICVAVMFIVKEFVDPRTRPKIKMPIPIELIIVVITILVSWQIGLRQNYGVATVGLIPQGIRTPKLPNPAWFPSVIGDAFVITIVVYSYQLSLAKTFAKKAQYEINANQEWFALGMCAIVSSFFGAYASGASVPRTSLQYMMGGITQVVSMVSCVIVLIVLTAVATVLRDLPKFVLAAVIFVAMKEFFMQFGQLKSLWQKSRIDFWIWVVTFTAVIVLEMSLGLAVGIGFAIVTIIFRSQWPNSVCLGKLPGTDFYKEINAYDAAEEIPGVKVYRFDCNLYFANVEQFRQELYKWTGIDPLNFLVKMKKSGKFPKWKRSERKPSNYPTGDPEASAANMLGTPGVESRPDIENGHHKIFPRWRKSAVSQTGSPPKSDANGHSTDGAVAVDVERIPKNPAVINIPLHHIVIDCSPFCWMGIMPVNTLAQVYEEYRTVGITVFFAAVTVEVRQTLEKCELYKKVPKRCFFVTVHDAVQAALSNPTLSLPEDSNLKATFVGYTFPVSTTMVRT